jgi:4-hydroxybenzoate polyprenyltransferase
LDWEAVLLALAVACWAGGFDILYHVQDRDFYVRDGLHSVAQRFGVVAAFRFAQALDAVAVAALVALGVWMELAFPFFVGCAIAAALMAWKYRMVSPTDLSRMGVSFMRMNALVSTTVLLSTLTAVLIDWGSIW